MIDIHDWLNAFLKEMEASFGERVYFAGLQGSYARGEATETSDIDPVVILDELSAADIRTYDDMLGALPHRELVCGFISGKKEILNWDAADLFQFYHDTKPLKGTLDDLLQKIDDAAVRRAVRTGACNIYHGCVHNMLHEKSAEILKGLYKAASFVIQAIHFRQTGRYVSRIQELLETVSPEERIVLENFLTLKSGGTLDFVRMSETLFIWSGKWISQSE